MEQSDNILTVQHLKKSYKVSSGVIDVLKDVNLELGNGVTAILWAYRDWETDRKSTRLNSSHITRSRMPSSA